MTRTQSVPERGEQCTPKFSVVRRVAVTAEILHRLLRQAHLLNVACRYYDASGHSNEEKAEAYAELLHTFEEERFELVEWGLKEGALMDFWPVVRPSDEFTSIGGLIEQLKREGWSHPDDFPVFVTGKGAA